MVSNSILWRAFVAVFIVQLSHGQLPSTTTTTTTITTTTTQNDNPASLSQPTTPPRSPSLSPTIDPGNATDIPLMNGLLQSLGFDFGERQRSPIAEEERVRPWEERVILAELISYMVTTGTARQIHLLYDDTTPDISPTVQGLSDHLGDVTVLAYPNGLDSLESAMRSYYHVEEMRNVVVICSPRNTLAIFEAVRERNLESPTIHWYVILMEDVSRQLISLIREGTQVSVAIKRSIDSYRLAVSFINKDNRPDFRQIGGWRWTRSTGSSAFISEPLTPDLSRLYSDFGGRQLKGAIVDNWPFFKVTTLDRFDGPYQEAIPHSGIDSNVINSIAGKLNFTYKLLMEPDQGWGGPQPDGTVTGMIGMVARREVHFAIDEITITGPRETVVDFTKPYFLESTTILSPAPAEKSRAGAIFSPFTPLVWAALVLMTLLIGPILAGVSWVMGLYLWEKPDCSIQKYAFHMFRNLVVQSNLILSPHWPHRFIFFFWYLFSFYIYALYAGTLTAVLAVPSFEKPIDSLWDLLAAMKKSGFHPLINFGTTNEFILKEATSGIYKEIWDEFKPEVGYVKNVDEGVNRVLTGKYAFMNAWLATEIRINKLGKNKYYMARQTYYPQGYGMVLNSGAPFKKVFEKLLTQLTESGLVSKWTRDEVRKIEGQSTDAEGGGSRGGPGAITLMHLQAAFFMLGMGLFVAGIILLTEVILHRRAQWRSGRAKLVISTPLPQP